MEIKIFPFVCKIYVVRCGFCDEFLGHLVVNIDAYGIEDTAHQEFRWCSGEGCDEKIKEAKKKFGERWLSVEPLTNT